MSNKLPYEDYLKQQWQDLPLPLEDAAWLDMKRRLEEDDDDGIIVWWRRGCLGWGIGLLVLVGLGWWLSQTSGIFSSSKKEVAQTTNEKIIDSASSKNIDSVNSSSITPTKNLNSIEENDTNQLKTESTTPIDSQLSPVDTAFTKPEPRIKETKKIEEIKKVKKEKPVAKRKGTDRSSVVPNDNRTRLAQSNKKRVPDQKQKKAQSDDSKRKDDKNSITNSNSIITDTLTTLVKNDTVKLVPKAVDTSRAKITVKTKVEKPIQKDSATNANVPKPKEKFQYYSAGIAMHQQLPLFGQKFTPYNAQGRKGSLLDYIPSVYARFNRSDKWFVQAEFRYGAPQYTKEIVYDKKIDPNPPGNQISTLHSVKKTYYHQLPISFNYYPVKNLSVGAGIVANKFSSAVFDEVVVSTDSVTQTDSLLSSGVFRTRNEKAFSKFYLQGLLEMQFKWKRFSLGGRYSFGIQPFLKFTLPGGVQQKERNQAGQLFLRYEFFKSKKKYK